MKYDELMVGDWIVESHGFPVQVVSVGQNYLYANYEGSGFTIVEFNDMDNKLYPILLTDEFFEKNDFNKKILYWSKGNFLTEIDGNNGYNISIKFFPPPSGPDANVHYVHELQQLLRLGGYIEIANNVKL
jgi:hypothetical protein